MGAGEEGEGDAGRWKVAGSGKLKGWKDEGLPVGCLSVVEAKAGVGEGRGAPAVVWGL